ncbi:MAG TPA: hypothetical protein VNU68_35085 [Verrucomicrobiae bacterium]|nr:hypothetical protein [Verrucomicrobiae bacterium]
MSIVALKWVSFSVSQLDPLVVDVDPNLPRGGVQTSNNVVGQSYNGSNIKAVKWLGTAVTALDDVSPGGDTQAINISTDSSIIYGWSDFMSAQPVRWTGGGTTGTILLPFAGYSGTQVAAGLGGSLFNYRAMSDNGRYVVGTSTGGPGLINRATIWDNGTPALLPDPTGATVDSTTSASSCDSTGATVVGFAGFTYFGGDGACFWYGGACYPLPGLPFGTSNGVSSFARVCTTGTTPSGGLIYGGIDNPTGNPNIGPCYWDSLTTTTAHNGVTFYGVCHVLDRFPGGPPGSINGIAAGVPTGVAVGQMQDAGGDNWAVRWDGTTATNLGALPGGGESTATGVSDDGTIVCGWSFEDGFTQKWPVYWDAANVIHKLPTVADFGDFFQGEALGISPDGTLIWGDGDAPTGPPPTDKTATVADLWFGQTGDFVDLTVEANRRNFISATGGARFLGVTGENPFGVTPPLFLTRDGAATTFTVNNGRGGPFSISSGTLGDPATNPPGSSTSTTVFTPAAAGRGVLGDYRNGNLYAFNPATLTDNGTQRRWLRRWRALPATTNQAVRFHWLSVDMQTGAGIVPDARPQVVLRWSDDGGHTFSDERIIPVGREGETNFTVKANRLGATRRFSGADRIFELSSSDPFVTAILDAEVDVS